jgi:hypothetical protein
MNPDNTAENTGTAPEEIITEPSQEPANPLETELNRETKQRTPAEKAAFTLRKNAESVAALGLDPAEVLGLNNQVPAGVDKDAPVTVGMLEAMQKDRSQKTALQLADEIPDQYERDLTKKYLLVRVVPSGDAHEDLRFARLAVNAVKSGQVIEELGRAGQPRSFASGAGAPFSTTQKEVEFTANELSFMRPPFNMTKEQILKARVTE